MSSMALLGIGVVGPGLADWGQAREVLSGRTPYTAAPAPTPAPALLPPNERRRATLATRVALEAARQATAGLGPEEICELATVCASSDGDMDLIDRLCTDIYGARVPVSPTVFHNSVHNAVAGYWSIAHGCRQASTSLAAWDGSLAAGLLESAAQLASVERPVLLVAYDVPTAGVLDSHRHFPAPFACALVLGRAPAAGSLASLELALAERAGAGRSAPDPDPDLVPDLEALRTGNPAARVLPLLRIVAAGTGGCMRLHYLDDLDLVLTASQP
jgi:hypothetical protein